MASMVSLCSQTHAGAIGGRGFRVSTPCARRVVPGVVGWGVSSHGLVAIAPRVSRKRAMIIVTARKRDNNNNALCMFAARKKKSAGNKSSTNICVNNDDHFIMERVGWSGGRHAGGGDGRNNRGGVAACGRLGAAHASPHELRGRWLGAIADRGGGGDGGGGSGTSRSHFICVVGSTNRNRNRNRGGGPAGGGKINRLIKHRRGTLLSRASSANGVSAGDDNEKEKKEEEEGTEEEIEEVVEVVNDEEMEEKTTPREHQEQSASERGRGSGRDGQRQRQRRRGRPEFDAKMFGLHQIAVAAAMAAAAFFILPAKTAMNATAVSSSSPAAATAAAAATAPTIAPSFTSSSSSSSSSSSFPVSQGAFLASSSSFDDADIESLLQRPATADRANRASVEQLATPGPPLHWMKMSPGMSYGLGRVHHHNYENLKPMQRLVYLIDNTLEQKPSFLLVYLAMFTISYVFIGGCVWWVICALKLKTTALGREPTFVNCVWAAWCCTVAASAHTHQINPLGRLLATSLTLGGLATYSMVTSTLSVTLRERLVTLEAARHYRTVFENGHVIVAGRSNNAHLEPILEQLDRSRAYARADGRATGKQTVIVISDEEDGGGGGEKYSHRAEELTAKLNLRELKVLCRTGSLSESETFARAMAKQAEKVVLLAGGDMNEADVDARALVGLLAVEGALNEMLGGGGGEMRSNGGDDDDGVWHEGRATTSEGGANTQNATKTTNQGTTTGTKNPDVIVEVSRASSTKLLRRVSSASAVKTEPVEKMTDRILAHCFRQNGLVDVYRKLMLHTDTIINLRNYPELESLPYGTLRRGFFSENAVVVGLIREDGEVDFHPRDDTLLRSADQVMIIAQKHSHRAPPRELVENLERVPVFLPAPAAAATAASKGEMQSEIQGEIQGEEDGGQGGEGVKSAASLSILRPVPGSTLEAALAKRSAEADLARAWIEVEEKKSDGRGEVDQERAAKGDAAAAEEGQEAAVGEKKTNSSASPLLTHAPPTSPPPCLVLVCGWWPGVVDAMIELDPLVSPGTRALILSEQSSEVRDNIVRRRLASRRARLVNVEVSHAVGNTVSRTDITAAVENLVSSSSSVTSSSSISPHHTTNTACLYSSSSPPPPSSSSSSSSSSSHPPSPSPPPPPSPPTVHVLAVGGGQDSHQQDSRNLYSVVNAADVCRELGVHAGHLVFEARDQRLGQQVTRGRPELSYVSSTELMALLTSQVIEHRDLNAVWTELLSSGRKRGGNAVLMKDIVVDVDRDARLPLHGPRGVVVRASASAAASDTDAVSDNTNDTELMGITTTTTTSFNQLAEEGALRHEVLIGYKTRRGDIVINPPDKDAPMDTRSIDKLIVIARPRSYEGFV